MRRRKFRQQLAKSRICSPAKFGPILPVVLFMARMEGREGMGKGGWRGGHSKNNSNKYLQW